ncbi:MAG: 2-amino-4-hydroxy-6-hydroxymethyldihydropteridine diphosphokinase [Muribaculaceae bacterium]|nr:2-amino-4-hydroxy-6-hydroxymethyldihydropteridine diphosphokinase [Muribaculaceae bacterium]
MRYYLNIGTNLGNRRKNLKRAIDALRANSTHCQVSQVVESDPWGFESQNRFLNVGIAIDSDMAPHDMLDKLHHIERSLGSASHRDARGGYVDRLVDIDIMAIDDEHGNPITINTPTLQVPHPHLYDRSFFLTPYRQLRHTT